MLPSNMHPLPKKITCNHFVTTGHANTRLLLYHCGPNGAFEAIYHAVPVICLPVFYDQLDIAQRFVSKGAGLRLDINTLNSETLVNAITRVTEDKR